jgi:histone H3/H4
MQCQAMSTKRKRIELEEEPEEELLPIHNLMKICKSVVPVGTKFNKKFKELIQLILFEFISIILNDKIQKGKKIINDEDVLESLDSLGISQYSDAIRLFMSEYRQTLFNTQIKLAITDRNS